MALEANNERDRATQDNSRRKKIPQRWNTDEKYQCAEDGDHGSGYAAATRYLRYVDLRTRGALAHIARPAFQAITV